MNEILKNTTKKKKEYSLHWLTYTSVDSKFIYFLIEWDQPNQFEAKFSRCFPRVNWMFYKRYGRRYIKKKKNSQWSYKIFYINFYKIGKLEFVDYKRPIK